VDHSAPKARHHHRRSHSSSQAKTDPNQPHNKPRRRRTRTLTLTSPRLTQNMGFINETCTETYFISVIDFLARYTMAKKGANFFKTFLWTPETLSTVPPDYYAQRWLTAVDNYFPPPENTADDVVERHLLGLPTPDGPAGSSSGPSPASSSSGPATPTDPASPDGAPLPDSHHD
jgi:hypothetical protein